MQVQEVEGTQEHLEGSPEAAGVWGAAREVGFMVSLGSTETHVLRKAKGTLLWSRSEGGPAAGPLSFPFLGYMLETWRGEEPLLLYFSD